MDIGPDNDNDSTDSLNTPVAFGGLEADGCLSNLLPNGQADLNILTREVNKLQQ